ncbi:uncharacterized protein LOC111369069 [Olea europaea var. sylvestris]|uniref:uncharacterized protein LOC111369069 n=1 Tax=Olea europaea var. sylvestris TaxID=158386 RepID=UPI000C1D330D|nr:uncharacterized protein LOC111369069 [Olea europaea var. sylvestris]
MSRLIIWDEAPMVNRCAVETVDRMFRDITDCNFLFGGKVVVLRGDFRQILPVVPKGKKEDIMKASLVFSNLWLLYLHLPLVENMRVNLDPTFYDYLLRIGDETKPEHNCRCIKLPNDTVLSFEDEITSLKNLIHHVFLDIEAYADNLHAMVDRVILTPTNECVDHINRILLIQIPVEIFTYYNFDEAIDKSEQSFQEVFLNSLTSNGIPPHELNLKVVMSFHECGSNVGDDVCISLPLQLILRLGEEPVAFNVFKAIKYPAESNNCFQIDVIDKAVYDTF